MRLKREGRSFYTNMKTTDLLEESYVALSANKVRSGLTMLGIVIGIASVIAMIAIGQGAQTDIEDRIQSIGSNLLTVSPGSQRGAGSRGVSGGFGSANTLTSEDADAIEESISFIQAIESEISSRYQVTARGTNTNTSVIGTTPEYLSVKNTELEQGAFISEQNIRSLSKVAVLGPETVTALFGENVNPVGQKIRINNLEFTIIGTTVAKGGTGFGSSDDLVFIPLTTAQRFFVGDSHVTSIGIQVETAEYMSSVQEEIMVLLLTRHNIANREQADFRIFNQADIIETASAITETFTILLGAVAGISLVVGGIGIMNMMLTSVTERTREIGLRKSIGAKGKDIRSQFLIEAVALTLIGGIVGIILGWGISFAVTAFTGITTQVTLFSVVLAFGVSFLIGIIFGYYPAHNASKLNPIEALRYE